MKFKKRYLLLFVVLMGIMIISQIHSLLANYNIVEDISLTTSVSTVKESETVTVTVADANMNDSKLVIPMDVGMEYVESTHQDGSIVFDSVNNQLVIDWLDTSKEQKAVTVMLKMTKEGSYALKALTVRDNQEVSTKEERIDVVGSESSKASSEDSESSFEESKTENTPVESGMSYEQPFEDEVIEEEPDSGKAYATQTGVWGTSSWSFDGVSGTLTINSGELGQTDMSPWSRNISKNKIKIIDFVGPIKAQKNSRALFSDLSDLNSISGLSNLDTSNVTDMSRMFNGMQNLKNLDVSNFDTSKVINMSLMFRENNVENLDVSNFDTSNVTDMSRMFNGMQNLKNLDVSNFDTSKVINMSLMFYYTENLKNLDVSNFDTSNVTNVSWMFSKTNVENLDVSNFDMSKVNNWSSMLGATNLKRLTLGVGTKLGGSGLLSPSALKEEDELSGNWIREDGQSKGYSPQLFMLNYGTNDLTPGTYVAEVILTGELTGETSLSNQTHSDGLFYVNDEVKLENTIHHKGDIWNFIYKTSIPEELTIDKGSFKGSVNIGGNKLDFPDEVFTFDKYNRTLEVNLKKIVEPDYKGNYYTAVDADFHYNITAKINKEAIGKNFKIDTTLTYFNSILGRKPDVNISKESEIVYGLEPQWELKKDIKNTSRSDEITAVGDVLGFTITATNSEKLGIMTSFDMAETMFPDELDFVSGSAELSLPDGTTKKLPDSVYQVDKQKISANVFSKNGYVGVEPYRLRFKTKVKDSAYGKILETKANLNGLTQIGTALNIDDERVEINVAYSGKLGFKETPKTLSFKGSFISAFTSTIERKDADWGVLIEDTRVQKQPWNLSVKQASPFESSEGDQLTQVMIFRKNGIEDKGIDVDNDVDVYSENNPNPNDYFISWKKNEGFFLKVPPGTAKAKQYQTELQWNLKDTPI